MAVLVHLKLHSPSSWWQRWNAPPPWRSAPEILRRTKQSSIQTASAIHQLSFSIPWYLGPLTSNETFQPNISRRMHEQSGKWAAVVGEDDKGRFSVPACWTYSERLWSRPRPLADGADSLWAGARIEGSSAPAPACDAVGWDSHTSLLSATQIQNQTMRNNIT